MQKLQMTTQTGGNVAVCAIKGNFDDAQTGVKNIFADASMKTFLEENGMEFSSANSINFGRLVPQIVYYVSAYCDLLKNGKLAKGERFNVAVPTGNFGNILAAVYAKRMGVPIGRLICASNRNNVLTDFIRTGVYDRNREFHTTSSPSMDILISSNLERMLYHLYDNDADAVRDLMEQLKRNGKYTVSAEVLKRLQAEFSGGFCDDEATADTIASMFRDHRYLCDTHTGVAVNVYRQYVEQTFGYDLSRTCDEIRPYYRHVETCQQTVPEAIIAFLESTGFEDALRNAVSLGGDSDTLACITGGIAEAFYGMPSELQQETLKRLPEEMRAAYELFRQNLERRM